jgi:hypothetical protein
MKVPVQTYINMGPGAFYGYRDGLDLLEPGPVVSAEGEDENIIAEHVFAIGNRMEADLDGQQWPSQVRSISVGDVIVIGETAMACESMGWRFVMDTNAITSSLENGERDARWDRD